MPAITAIGTASPRTTTATIPVLASIGFTLPAHRIRTMATVPIEPFPGRDLTADDLLGADDAPDTVGVIVIGSGAGGAVAAANLAGARP